MNFTDATKLLRVMYPKSDYVTEEEFVLADIFTFEQDYLYCGAMKVRSLYFPNYSRYSLAADATKLKELTTYRNTGANTINPIVAFKYGEATPVTYPDSLKVVALTDSYAGYASRSKFIYF